MRFYLPNINKSNIELTGDAHTHAAYSLRIRVGDYITVFDGNGNEYSCKVKEIKKDRTLLDVLDSATNVGEAGINVTLYLSMIKQDRFELATQKATELGVTSIVPVYSTYSQRNTSLNYERLTKIAISACEQCGRSRIPTIEHTIEFDELLNRAKNTYLIFPWEREMHGDMRESIDKSKTDIAVFIGPEGGITEPEKIALTEAGAKSVTLGRRILRAETAAISALSVVYYEMGEWTL
ncbi:MAG: 16S rRNA (uracil(1498)-N(3))-methyltransferase [Clostridiales bacterium]|nr:16S rRNA (uracil(1498)-N(3))-methyltransferase [Clostridiales bacterium]